MLGALGEKILWTHGIMRLKIMLQPPVVGARKTTNTEQSYKPWSLERPLSWALDSECGILVFLWSLEPLSWFATATTLPPSAYHIRA